MRTAASLLAIVASATATELADRATTCTFSGTTGAAAAISSQAACNTIILDSVVVPAATTLDLSKLQDNTKVVFQGETTFGYSEWSGPLVQVKGTGISVDGTTGTINCDGSRWWDTKGTSGKVKPKFFAAHGLTNANIINLSVKNTPLMAFSIANTQGLTMTNITIDNTDGDNGGGKNTDAFDIGTSSNIHIDGATVHNQDDCVAVNSGSDILFENGSCTGGHGLSIGSVGGRALNTVSNVTFANSKIINSANGIRVKSIAGANGSITGVTYRQITLSNIAKYGILVEQNYNGGDLKGTPTTGVPITKLTLDTINGAGAIASSGTNIAIACGSGSCSDWTWTSVSVSGGKTYGSCTNLPTGIKC